MIDVLKTPYFEKQYLLLEEVEQEALEDVIWHVRQDPTSGYQRKGKLANYWTFDYTDNFGRKQVHYNIGEKQITIVMVNRISNNV